VPSEQKLRLNEDYSNSYVAVIEEYAVGRVTSADRQPDAQAGDHVMSRFGIEFTYASLFLSALLG
jgi:hypothetical protein